MQPWICCLLRVDMRNCGRVPVLLDLISVQLHGICLQGANDRHNAGSCSVDAEGSGKAEGGAGACCHPTEGAFAGLVPVKLQILGVTYSMLQAGWLCAAGKREPGPVQQGSRC